MVEERWRVNVELHVYSTWSHDVGVLTDLKQRRINSRSSSRHKQWLPTPSTRQRKVSLYEIHSSSFFDIIYLKLQVHITGQCNKEWHTATYLAPLRCSNTRWMGFPAHHHLPFDTTTSCLKPPPLMLVMHMGYPWVKFTWPVPVSARDYTLECGYRIPATTSAGANRSHGFE